MIHTLQGVEFTFIKRSLDTEYDGLAIARDHWSSPEAPRREISPRTSPAPGSRVAAYGVAGNRLAPDTRLVEQRATGQMPPVSPSTQLPQPWQE